MQTNSSVARVSKSETEVSSVLVWSQEIGNIVIRSTTAATQSMRSVATVRKSMTIVRSSGFEGISLLDRSQ